ncbi:cyclodeaminase/cyclohydrolase family protein [bacterium]|nr:cyclodeaminase/cyclohydrolase family protein [bacterium]MCI0602843.1 cyclodeaminase/cyclohydrolase family protein [bacterium]
MEQKPKLDPNQLASWTISDFLKKLASEDPVPGGGSVSALAGALGAALIAMYGKLGTLRKGVSGDDQEVLQKISIEASSYQNKLTRLITEDSLAYTEVMQAYKLSKTTEEESKIRQQSIQRAFHVAVEIPLETMNACIECLHLIAEVALIGNPSAFSDLKVAQFMCHAGAKGAMENILINLPSLKDQEFVHMVEAKLTKLKQALENFSKQKIEKPA